MTTHSRTPAQNLETDAENQQGGRPTHGAVIVDESWVSRAAYSAALESGGYTVRAIDYRERLPTIPSDLSLALVNLADPCSSDEIDDFPGFAALEAIRVAAPKARTIGYSSLADKTGLRLRCIHLGLSALHSRSELEDGTVDSFLKLISSEAPSGLKRLQRCDVINTVSTKVGLPLRCETEALLRDLRALLDEQDSLGRTKTATQRRQDFGETYALASTRTDGSQYTDRRAPSWKQLQKLWAILTQAAK